MRKRTNRKHYQLVNPITWAIAGAAVTDTALLDQLRLRELMHLDAFKRGEPTLADWRGMGDLLNVAETMACDGIGAEEVLPAIHRARAALLAGHQRHACHGRIGRGAGEYEALLELYEYHDLQRCSVSRSRYELAIRATVDRIRSGRHAGLVVLK